MKIIGLIAEYNPFHNGHLYQINKIKGMYPDAIIIAVISTNFTQRGDISIVNKWDKTKICLNYGIDIVVELPTLYATQSADIFAYGALAILNKFKIDTLVFGTETEDIEILKKLADIQINNFDYDRLVKKYLDEGYNYPTAMSQSLNDIINIKIDKPNDLLALSYLKEIIKNNYPITPIAIKRTNDYHGLTSQNNIASASLIRKMFQENKDVTPYIPKLSKNYPYQKINYSILYNLITYNIITNQTRLKEYLTVDEGIENRILKYIYQSTDYQELVTNLKTKRYTYNKINRMLIHTLLNIKKTDNTKDIYLRVLGFNHRGQTYLNKIKKEIDIPIYTNYQFNKNQVLDIEFKSTCIYSLIVEDKSLIEKEYKNKPIIMK